MGPIAPPFRLLQASVLLCALGPPGVAAAEEDPVVLEVEPEKERLECPAEQPALLVRPPHDGTMKLEVTQQGGAGATHTFAGELKAGQVTRRAWPQTDPEGTWTATLHIDYAGGKTYDGVMGFSFVCAPPIGVKLGKGGLDLGKGRLMLDVEGPAVRAEIHVTSDDGGDLVRKTETLAKKRRRKALAIRWPADDRGFGGLTLRVFDAHGAWVELRLVPLSLEIPHEEVEFASGKWDVRPSEEPKLEDTLATIRDELGRFVDDLAVPSLYIVGYTDTVGSKRDNIKLSANRARSIGHWFRKSGLDNPILYQGFGEDILAVETGDETPEPANRRAVYILTNFPPPVQEAIPRAAWRPLR